MPRAELGKYIIEIRTNEHNHKKQKAHLHIYFKNKEVGSIFLDGTLRHGKIKSRDLKRIARYVAEYHDYYQAEWDKYQQSEY